MEAHQALVAHLELTITDTVYAGRNEPPDTHQPSNPCVVLKRRDDGFTYDDDHAVPSFQVKCYAETEVDALNLYEAVKTAIHHQTSQFMKYGELEGGGNILHEQTDWPYVLAYFGVMLTLE